MNALWTFFIFVTLIGTTPTLNRIAKALEAQTVECSQGESGK